MIDDYFYVTVGGVFPFDDLELLSATIHEVFNEFPLRVKGVPYRTDEVLFVMFGFKLWV